MERWSASPFFSSPAPSLLLLLVVLVALPTIAHNPAPIRSICVLGSLYGSVCAVEAAVTVGCKGRGVAQVRGAKTWRPQRGLASLKKRRGRSLNSKNRHSCHNIGLKPSQPR